VYGPDFERHSGRRKYQNVKKSERSEKRKALKENAMMNQKLIIYLQAKKTIIPTLNTFQF